MAEARTRVTEANGDQEQWDRAADEGPAAEEGAEAEVLDPNSVRLSDGRVAIVKRTTGIHDLRVDKLLGRFGYSLAGMGGAIYLRFRAVLAIESIDGEIQFFPKHQQALEDRLDLPTEDIEKITRAYARLNGLDRTEDQDSFR